MAQFDYLVVGQGLAGTALTYQLKQLGCRVKVVDHGLQHAASVVAAGLWNPVSFRQLSPVWQAEKLIEYLHTFYPSLEKELGESFFHPLEMWRIFADHQSALQWFEKSAGHPFLYTHKAEPIDLLNAPHGIGVVKNCGWVNLPKMLNAFRRQLIARGELAEESFQFDALVLSDQDATYQSEKFRAVICCSGWSVAANPYFNEVRIIPNKGHVLTMKLHGNLPRHIYHFGRFLLPLGDHRWKLGATYEPNVIYDGVNESLVQNLQSDLHKVYKGSAQALEVVTGYRPTTPDRRPMAGRHSKWRSLAIFNGLGSRGVLLAPYMAYLMARHLVLDEPLPAEVNPTRF